MTCLTPRNLFRRSFGNDSTTFIAGFRTQINHPIRAFDHIQVVFDDHHGMAGINEALKNLQQHANVVEVQARRRFVEKEQGGFTLWRRSVTVVGAPLLFWIATVTSRCRFCEVTHELEALAFAPGQGVDRLTKTEITEADFLQQVQFFNCALCRARLRKSCKKLDNCIHTGIEQVGDAPIRS
jgi:hypothetical protein